MMYQEFKYWIVRMVSILLVGVQRTEYLENKARFSVMKSQRPDLLSKIAIGFWFGNKDWYQMEGWLKAHTDPNQSDMKVAMGAYRHISRAKENGIDLGDLYRDAEDARESK